MTQAQRNKERLIVALDLVEDALDYIDCDEACLAFIQFETELIHTIDEWHSLRSAKEDLASHENYCHEHGGHLRNSPACDLAKERARR